MEQIGHTACPSVDPRIDLGDAIAIRDSRGGMVMLGEKSYKVRALVVSSVKPKLSGTN